MASTMNAPPVQYVRTSDGYNIAFCDSGDGRSFIVLPQPSSHLHVFWTEDTFVRPWYEGLAQRFRLVQYDGRGQGMSTRGLPEDFSLDDMLIDLDAVIQRTGLEHFVLMGFHWAGHTAIRYALQNPERVDAIVVSSCPVSLAAWSLAALQGIANSDWDGYLRALAGLAKSETISIAVERLKKTVDQRDWRILMKAAVSSDVGPLLPRLRTPALVLHPRESLNLPPEESMKLAALIPGARLTLIEGATPFGDHVTGLAAIDVFLANLRAVSQAASGSERFPPISTVLSSREVEVLRLLAQGKSNPEIAKELFITRNTVQNHVSSILIKTNLTNRAQAAVYARDNGIA